MFGFLKKRVPARELGVVLARLAIDTSNIEQMVAEMQKGSEFDDSLMDESLFLQLFMVDYAASEILGPRSQEKQEALDAFYNQLAMLTRKIDGMKAGEGTSFFSTFQQRISIYAKAVNTPHRNGPAWNVGKEFAHLCGREKDIDTIMFGNFLFGASMKWVRQTIESCRVVV